MRRARTSLLALASLSYTSKRPLCCTLTESAEPLAAKLPGESFLESPLASACRHRARSQTHAGGTLRAQRRNNDCGGACGPRTFRSSMSKFQLLTPRTYLHARTQVGVCSRSAAAAHAL